MAEFYGNKVGHWSVYTTCDVNQQNNGAVQLHIQTYFQTWDQWDYYGIDAEYSHAVNGSNRSAYTDDGINVARNARQRLLDDYVWVNRTRNNISIPFNSHINVSGYASGWSAGSGSISIGAKPSYTVSYNANGGSGAPGSQTRWWGEVINLSNTKPTRTNYEFLGWSTSAGGGVNYPSGARYGEDTSRTLYAVWKLSLVAPTIKTVDSWRSDASGNADSGGNYATVKVTWSVDTTVDTNNTGVTMVISGGASNTTNLSGTSGTYQKTFSGIDVGNSYVFNAKLTDKHMSISASARVGPSFFLLDINPQGTGIGIGQAAPSKGLVVGGTYFATDVANLPILTTINKGNRAYVNGELYIWDGSNWISDFATFSLHIPFNASPANITIVRKNSICTMSSFIKLPSISQIFNDYKVNETLPVGFRPVQDGATIFMTNTRTEGTNNVGNTGFTIWGNPDGSLYVRGGCSGQYVNGLGAWACSYW